VAVSTDLGKPRQYLQPIRDLDLPIGEFAQRVGGNGLPKPALVEAGVGCIDNGPIYTTRYDIWTDRSSRLPRLRRGLSSQTA